MGRAPRQFAPGATYHVWARGSNRQPIFVLDSDRVDFFACLWRVVQQGNLRCLAYCLMSNHYHLVVETTDGELSSAMKRLNGRYAARFNRRHGQDAHLFKNRFGVAQQETEAQLLWTIRYTVRNPVEVGLCGTAAGGDGAATGHRLVSTVRRRGLTSRASCRTSETRPIERWLSTVASSTIWSVSDTVG